MIIDKARIFIKAGNGGNGAVSFHREKYVAAGGPDGGDGGDGGSVVFHASENTRTLMDFKYTKKFMAESGASGQKNNMKGRAGQDLMINVPPGTVIIDEETNKVVADIREGKRVILKGGRGGKGNARFATATRRTPRFATPGAKTTGRFVILELKSIADVGLIGFPNAGKSTLLSVISKARPKIADYPFTTLNPNLGVCYVADESFVAADIPGLIEGAGTGAGLGHDFLKHIERTRMLVHVIDVSGFDGRDPVEAYDKIRTELSAYSAELIKKPEIVVANKIDITGAQQNAMRLKEELFKRGIDVLFISAAANSGVKQLMHRVAEELKKLPPAEPIFEEGVIEEWEASEARRDFDVSKGEDGVIEANGNAIDEIFRRINPDDPNSMRHFEKLLSDFGIIAALRDYGVKDGDTVRLNGEEFDFID